MNRDTFTVGGCALIAFASLMAWPFGYGWTVLILGCGIVGLATGILMIWDLIQDERARKALIERAERLRRERERSRLGGYPAGAPAAAIPPLEPVEAAARETLVIDLDAEDEWEVESAHRIPVIEVIPRRRMEPGRAEKSMAECPVCQGRVLRGELYVTCPACGTPHHQDCWEYYGGCGVYGCPQGPQKGVVR
ncbi:MAG: hypothetical protein HPY44_02090 [Armatimonadetes bacterium]|nr:hypothetical protein [Armatimonadota bacterium]